MNYYSELLNLSLKANKINCVPVSAIVVKNDKIISKAYNRRDITNNILDHAEIIAINKATKKLKTWNLSDCDLYVSMKPCKMCEAIINESRIKKVYYILDNEEYDIRKNNELKKINYYVLEDKDNCYLKILKDFFKKLRKKR